MRSHRLRAGFTLIELMFAIVIGAIVVTGLYSLFRLQMKQFIFQDLQMEMHQNGRMALDIVSRTGRMAGYGTSGETWGVFGSGGSAGNSLPAVVAYNGTGPNGSDAITVVSMDPALVINTNATVPPSCDTSYLSFDPVALHNAARLAQYQAGELVMCYDYAGIGGFKSYLWTLTGAGDATSGQLTIADNSSLTDYANECTGDENLPLVMVCSRAEVATFYIDADDTDGVGAGSFEHPVLMMDLDFDAPGANDVPVVDNVEDMQIAYCVQGASGTTDCSVDSAWQDTVSSAEVDQIYMMRISMVIRSSREDMNNQFPGVRPALEDNAGGSTNDTYFRTVVSTEIVTRNLRVQANL